jgi:hypothetical protein
MMKLNEYSRTILFDSGKASKKETYPTTKSIKNILIQDFLVRSQHSDGSNE